MSSAKNDHSEPSREEEHGRWFGHGLYIRLELYCVNCAIRPGELERGLHRAILHTAYRARWRRVTQSEVWAWIEGCELDDDKAAAHSDPSKDIVALKARPWALSKANVLGSTDTNGSWRSGKIEITELVGRVPAAVEICYSIRRCGNDRQIVGEVLE